MLNKLVLSSPGPRGWLRNPSVIIGSVALHLVALGGLLWATGEAEAVVEPAPEQVTYIDITELPPPPPEPEQIFEAAPEPPPPDASPAPAPAPRAAPPPPPQQRAAPAPQRAPAQPRTPPPSAAAATPAPGGFQELSVPNPDLSGIPAPDLSTPAVRAEDFGGRGAVGGTASGTQAAGPAPRGAAGGRPGGTGTGAGTGTDAGGTTYSANLVDEQAELSNRGDVARILARRYPETLRNAGIDGRVVVQFVVDRNGRVEAGSVRIVSTTDPAFANATREALQDFRFRPGKVQGQSVRQLVQLPITWNLSR